MVTDKDKDIENYAAGLSHADDAQYSRHDAEVLGEYTGCVDAIYPDTFLAKIWKLLQDEVYAFYDTFTPIRIMAVNNLGARLLKSAPKNTEIFSLNNNFICYLASKAILQQTELDWEFNVQFGNIANYFYLPYEAQGGEEIFGSYKYQVIMVNYEKDNDYYKAVDSDKELTELPYYLYCIVRGSKFICPDDVICLTIPDEHNEEFLSFDLAKYGLEIAKDRNKNELIVKDINFKAYIIKPVSSN